MKIIFWLSLIALIATSAILWRGNQRLRSEVESYTELIHTAAPTPTETPQAEPEPIAKNADPEATANAALRGESADELNSALYQWAQDDPKAALAWFEEKQSSGALDPRGPLDPITKLYGTIVAGIVATDPKRGLELIAEQEDPRERYSHVMSAVVLGDAESVDNLIDHLAQGNPESEQLTSIASALGLANRFDQAVSLLDKFESLPPEQRNEIAIRFVQNVRLEDIDNHTELADWVIEASPDENAKSTNASSFVQRWAGVDFDKTAVWLNAQPPGTWRDNAVATFAREAKKADTETAREWVETIEDESIRKKALKSLEE